MGWKHHENQWRGWEAPIPLDLQRRYFDDIADLLPSLVLPISPEAERPLYRTSLEGPGPLRDRLRQLMPSAVQLTCHNPMGTRRSLKPASGAAIEPSPTNGHRQPPWGSPKKLNLFLSDAFHVTRTAVDWDHSWPYHGRLRSGV